mmetsp:Transcript_106178/g.265942  ORF Transcript_106178/g.265942 Transcript_106178/m.265942 type:complete len:274 (+) Transcript_106178:632-1453(+)
MNGAECVLPEGRRNILHLTFLAFEPRFELSLCLAISSRRRDGLSLGLTSDTRQLLLVLLLNRSERALPVGRRNILQMALLGLAPLLELSFRLTISCGPRCGLRCRLAFDAGNVLLILLLDRSQRILLICRRGVLLHVGLLLLPPLTQLLCGITIRGRDQGHWLHVCLIVETRQVLLIPLLDRGPRVVLVSLRHPLPKLLKLGVAPSIKLLRGVALLRRGHLSRDLHVLLEVNVLLVVTCAAMCTWHVLLVVHVLLVAAASLATLGILVPTNSN